MKKIVIKLAFGAVIGGVIGFSYYYFIGCDGGCPITGSPYISTLYGVIAGGAVAFPSKTRSKQVGEGEG